MTVKISDSIFEIFRKHRIPANGMLFPHHITATVHLWNKDGQDAFEPGMNDLIDQGYVSREDDSYRLTQKGYNYIYRHFSIEDTIDIILADFRKRRIGMNDMLLLPALLGTLQGLDRYHFDHYDKAILQMERKGWITSNGRGFILTREGHSLVFPN